MARGSGRRPKRDAAATSSPAPDDPVSGGSKILPRNLTARAAWLVAGNPAVSRPEDAVANCFPGLELDVRNFDRRFFPGLVFDFVSFAGQKDPQWHYGARLGYVAVYEDPELQIDPAAAGRLEERGLLKTAQKLYDELTGDTGGSKLASGDWYIDWIEQGARLSTKDLDGLQVWRLVRGLRPDKVVICLRQRPRGGQVILHGWRRFYADPVSGVISDAFQPGELMQGLCSPWQHDFRDCACHYWASNHPDVVLGESYPGEPLAGGESPVSELNMRLDWLRADRSREMAAEAFPTIPGNRPYQIDHFEINRAWQDLNVVLEGREIGGVYVPDVVQQANPYGTPVELANELSTWLAPLELTLVFEYLYARSSVVAEEEARARGGDTLADAAAFVRQHLLMVAASEMHHLRWANEILWELRQAELVRDFAPALHPSEVVPSGHRREPTQDPAHGRLDRTRLASYTTAEGKHEFHPPELKEPTLRALQAAGYPDRDVGFRPRKLSLLSKELVDNYIALEHPSNFIDGAYARVIATLAQPHYPPHLVELARRIASEGMQHESRFLEIKAALSPFAEAQYLRTGLSPQANGHAEAALGQLQDIVSNLKQAYDRAGHERLEQSGPFIAKARTAMNGLLELGDRLAAQDIGIDLFKLWPFCG